MSLNAQYLQDVLSKIKSDSVRFSFANPVSHILIQPQEDVIENGIAAKYIISKVVV
ncbi:MAG: hypothetical protein ACI4M9_02920 [Succinivibrio sp.]